MCAAFDSVGITILAPTGSYQAGTGLPLQLQMPNGTFNTQDWHINAQLAL